MGVTSSQTIKAAAFDAAGNRSPVLTSDYVISTATAPAAPTAVTAVAGNASATVNWTAPANGGSPILDYTVQTLTLGAAVPDVTVTGTSATVSGLTNGTQYAFKVTARNAAGSGPASSQSNTVVPAPPATRPGAPTGISATAGNAQATVRWVAPADGGSAITSYEVLVRTGTTVVKTVPVTPGTSTSTVVTGLLNGTSYNFRVRAINAVGTGAYSVVSAAVTPATVPGQPAIGTAVAGTTGGAITATANWPAATNTGGSAITGYKIRALRMSSTGTVLGTTTSALLPASSRSLQMTLPLLGNYRFTVQAFNAIGASLQSARSNLVAGR
ncbi:MAG: fibronectin type III domain-containing protein [Propionibacteriales bacterium]|nr:fibronectin type III domain-containing protein [Propionibacteriales bacterium]